MNTKNHIQLTEEQIKEIAGDLNAGFRVFYNLKTKEKKSLPDNRQGFDIMEELEEEYDEIEENPEDYFELEKMDSHDAFLMMEDFTETVDDKQLQKELLRILSRAKPFRNFKYAIDDSGDYRQQWFDFEAQRTCAHIKEQIADYNEPDSEY